MTTLLGIASLASFANDESGAGLALGATAGLFLAAAVRGNTAANECRAAFDEYNTAYRSMRQQELFAREREDEAPRPVMVKKPAKMPAKKPVAEVPIEPVQEQLDVEQKQAPVAPEYATPRPTTTKPAKQPEPKKPKPSDPGDDDWSVFWKEEP